MNVRTLLGLRRRKEATTTSEVSREVRHSVRKRTANGNKEFGINLKVAQDTLSIKSITLLTYIQALNPSMALLLQHL